MRIGVVKEVAPGETRVALAPESVRKILALGRPPKKKGADAEAPPPESKVQIIVQAGAGERAFLTDDDYRNAGATVEQDSAAAWGADLVVCVNPPTREQIARMRRGGALLGLLRPAQSPDVVRALAEAGVAALAFEAVPRITRAQKVDVLSSMSTIAGYRATILAAEACPKLFPMLMTAAGTVTPARALVIGAGVAGLQAIATCKRLGAVVEAYDVRPAVKEQVQSLGARFVELPIETGGAETAGGYAKQQTEETLRKQRELLADHIAHADVVITTALVPGKPAPRLIDEPTVKRMRPGAVIVDLAAEAGGNCALTKPGERAVVHGVTIIGPPNLAAQAPVHASLLYSRNVTAFVEDLAPGGELSLNMSDEVIGGAMITFEGEIVHAAMREAMGLPPLAKEAAA